MRKASIPMEQLKRSKVAGLNRQVIEDLEKPAKKDKRLPNQPAPQVLWMWGQLAAWSLKSGIQVVQELPFHPVRKWRFDFALPVKMVAIEYEGIFSEKSGHTTHKGYIKDVEKYNEAQALGWDVIRFTAKDYRKVIETLEKHLQNAKEE
jgi:very-short-patch-repair endonuclease